MLDPTELSGGAWAATLDPPVLLPSRDAHVVVTFTPERAMKTRGVRAALVGTETYRYRRHRDDERGQRQHDDTHRRANRDQRGRSAGDDLRGRGRAGGGPAAALGVDAPRPGPGPGDLRRLGAPLRLGAPRHRRQADGAGRRAAAARSRGAADRAPAGRGRGCRRVRALRGGARQRRRASRPDPAGAGPAQRGIRLPRGGDPGDAGAGTRPGGPPGAAGPCTRDGGRRHGGGDPGGPRTPPRRWRRLRRSDGHATRSLPTLRDAWVPTVDLPHGTGRASFHVILAKAWARDLHYVRDVALCSTTEL